MCGLVIPAKTIPLMSSLWTPDEGGVGNKHAQGCVKLLGMACPVVRCGICNSRCGPETHGVRGSGTTKRGLLSRSGYSVHGTLACKDSEETIARETMKQERPEAAAVVK